MTTQIRRLTTRILFACAIFSMLIPLAEPAHATKVRSLGLVELTHRAATVFSGRCVEVRSEIDPALGIPVTVARFRVDRLVKGRADRVVTLRTPAAPDRVAGGAASLIPRYREGEEVVLFLYGTSDLGMASPVGLGQGKMTVVRDKAGRRTVVDGLGRRPAFGDRRREAADPEALLDHVATLLHTGGAR